MPDSAWARGEKGGNRTRNTTWNTVKRFFLLSYLPMLPAQTRNLLAALLTLHSLGLGFAAFYLQRHSCGFRDTGAGPWVRTTARRKRYRAHLRRWATVPRILPVFPGCQRAVSRPRTLSLWAIRRRSPSCHSCYRSVFRPAFTDGCDPAVSRDCRTLDVRPVPSGVLKGVLIPRHPTNRIACNGSGLPILVPLFVWSCL